MTEERSRALWRTIVPLNAVMATTILVVVTRDFFGEQRHIPWPYMIPVAISLAISANVIRRYFKGIL